MTRTTIIFFTLCSLAVCNSGQAGTIVKLGFSNDPIADVMLSGEQLTTVDDGIGATAGDQNTEVTFLGVLSSQPGVSNANASVTLSGISLDGTATTIGNIIVQPTSGGGFSLYDQNNSVLLEGTLGAGTITGPISGASTGSFLTTDFGTFTGGSLVPLMKNFNQSSWSVSLTNVNGANGFDTTQSGALADFEADATANIAVVIPEPDSVILFLLGCLSLLSRRRILARSSSPNVGGAM